MLMYLWKSDYYLYIYLHMQYLLAQKLSQVYLGHWRQSQALRLSKLSHTRWHSDAPYSSVTVQTEDITCIWKY